MLYNRSLESTHVLDILEVYDPRVLGLAAMLDHLVHATRQRMDNHILSPCTSTLALLVLQASLLTLRASLSQGYGVPIELLMGVSKTSENGFIITRTSRLRGGSS